MERTLELMVVAVFSALLVSGCSREPKTPAQFESGSQTVTFYVQDMGERLDLF